MAVKRLSFGAWILTAAALTAACGQDAQALKAAAMSSGDTFFKGGKYAQAIIEYRKAIQVDVRFGEARLKLAESYEKSGDIRNAYREYLRAADLLPTNSELQVKVGSLLLQAQQYEDAKGRAERALETAPKSIDAQLLLGNALVGMNDTDGAIKQIEQAIQLDPKQAISYSTLGTVHLARGEREDAERAFRKAIETEPKSIEARLALAVYLWTAGRRLEVEAPLKQVIGLDAKNQPANRMLAMLYLTTDRNDEAERYLKAAANGEDAYTAQIALARYYTLVNRVGDATAVLNSIRESSQGYPLAQVELSKIEYRAGHKDKAYQIVDALNSKPVVSPPGLLLKSQYLSFEGKTDEAIVKAKAAVEADPKFVEGHYALGLYYTAKGQNNAAIASFNETIKLNPQASAAQAQMARLQLVNGKAAASVQLAEQALKNQADSPETRLVYIRGLIATGDLNHAESEIRQLQSTSPNSPAVYAQMGLLQITRGNMALAKTAFTKALSLRPAFADAVGGLIAIDLRNKDVASARSRSDAAVAAAPKDPDILLLAARTYGQTGDLAKAERLLRTAIEVSPSTLDAYGMLGAVYQRQGKLDDALREFETVAAKEPNSVSANTMVAMILHRQGKIPEARARYETVLKIDPRAAVAANNLAMIMTDEEGANMDVALQLAKTASEVLADRADINDTIGWIYYKKNLPALALPWYKLSIEKDPKNPLYHYHLGLAYVKSHNTTLARESLERALALPNFQDASAAREIIASFN